MAPIYWKIMLYVTLAANTAIVHGQEFEEYTNCASNYTTLENALFNTGDNIYRLTTTFFPPHVDNPLYVTVTYTFSDMNFNESIQYIWSTASLYLTIEPRTIRFLSLFFCYVEDDRIVDLELELPSECYSTDFTENQASNASNFLFVLTQRVCNIQKYLPPLKNQL
jgi:hypothetical protein